MHEYWQLWLLGRFFRVSKQLNDLCVAPPPRRMVDDTRSTHIGRLPYVQLVAVC